MAKCSLFWPLKFPTMQNLVLLMFARMITHYTVYENECFGVYLLAYMVKKTEGL